MRIMGEKRIADLQQIYFPVRADEEEEEDEDGGERMMMITKAKIALEKAGDLFIRGVAARPPSDHDVQDEYQSLADPEKVGLHTAMREGIRATRDEVAAEIEAEMKMDRKESATAARIIDLVINAVVEGMDLEKLEGKKKKKKMMITAPLVEDEEREEAEVKVKESDKDNNVCGIDMRFNWFEEAILRAANNPKKRKRTCRISDSTNPRGEQFQIVKVYKRRRYV
ncbi:hypothetical protein GGS20DRAFT_558209 [Poronia punctata]|nr:hypothetical protein GGS20DRAFT_558209 [Poronia punctata]